MVVQAKEHVADQRKERQSSAAAAAVVNEDALKIIHTDNGTAISNMMPLAFRGLSLEDLDKASATITVSGPSSEASLDGLEAERHAHSSPSPHQHADEADGLVAEVMQQSLSEAIEDMLGTTRHLLGEHASAKPHEHYRVAPGHVQWYISHICASGVN